MAVEVETTLLTRALGQQSSQAWATFIRQGCSVPNADGVISPRNRAISVAAEGNSEGIRVAAAESTLIPFATSQILMVASSAPVVADVCHRG